MASRFVAPKRLETLDEVRQALQLVQEQLDAISPPADSSLITKDVTLRAGAIMRVSPRQGAILTAKLPKATADNFGQTITLILERPVGTLKISAQKPDKVGGLDSVLFTVAGLILLESNGTDAWALINQIATNSPGAVGTTGPQGPPGSDFSYDYGEQFVIPGQTGAQGVAGAVGATGATGAVGAPGMDAYDAPFEMVIPGPAGTNGTNGSNGAVGAQGPPGPMSGDFNYGEPEPIQVSFPPARSEFDADDLQTEAGVGPLDVILRKGVTRLVFSAANPIINSISGGEDVGRTVLVYFSGTGVALYRHNTGVPGPSGTESRLFNPDNRDQNLAPRGSFTLQANGTAGWRTVNWNTLQLWTAGDAVNPINTIDLYSGGTHDIVMGTGSASGAITCQAGNSALFQCLGGTATVKATNGDLTLTAVTGSNTIIGGNQVRIVSASALTSPGFLSILEGAASTPTVAAGDGMLWVENQTPNQLTFTDDNNTDWPMNVHGVAGNSAIQVASAATTVLTGATYTVPANSLRVGSTFLVNAMIQWERGATLTAVNVVVTLNGGGVALATATITCNLSAGVTGLCHVTGMVTVFALGGVGVGAMLGQLQCPNDFAELGAAYSATTLRRLLERSVNTAALFTVTTTAAQPISLTANMSAAVATTVLRITNCNILRVR